MRRPATRGRAAWPAISATAACTALLLAGCTSNDSQGVYRPNASHSAVSHHASPKDPEDRKKTTVRPRSVAAMGDSISRGFDACSVLADCPEVSWVTGTDKRVDSLAARLTPKTAAAGRQKGETVGNSWNLAKSGAKMADLPGQVGKAVAKKPELVTILMGANDACRDSTDQMTPVSDYRRDLDRSLDTLHRKLPDTRVLVASIPDLQQLWKVGRKNPLAKAVWKLGICPSMLNNPDSMGSADKARRAAVGKRVDEFNDVLKSSCTKYPTCTFDGGAVHRYKFSLGQLSPWDWFHPSVRGQAELASIMYKAEFPA